MRYLLVGNPTAQSGKGKERIVDALEAMRGRGLEVDFVSTQPEGRTAEVVKVAVDQGAHGTVIALGGDGTFADVAKGMLAARRSVPMALMPAGTGNDQGKSFGISAEPGALEENIDVLLEAHRIQMDVGTVTAVDRDGTEGPTHLWFDNMGFGMAPAILQRRNRDRSAVEQIPVVREVYRDQVVYAGAMLGETLAAYIEDPRFEVHLGVDGQPTLEIERVTDVLLNNTPMYGGEWIPVRTARADDGQLDLTLLRGNTDMLATLVRDHKLTPQWLPLDGGEASNRNFRGRRFDIRLLQPAQDGVPSQIDGEEWAPGNHFVVDVLPGRLPVIVRRDFRPPWKSE